MAPKDDDLGDIYELLGIEEGAGDKEINGAFRKGSLKWHPDKNPDNPEAAETFDKLSRAKELLLDPQRRAAYDEGRKAKRLLEERFAQEDSKRRKFREDLESRENRSDAARAKASEAVAAAEMKKKYAQMDFAARIRAKEAEKAGRQADLAAVAASARSNAEEAKVRVKWRDPGSVDARAEALKLRLAEFDLRSIAMEGELEAVIQLGSKEDAIKAALRSREMKHQWGFRVLLERPASGGTSVDGGEARAGAGDSASPGAASAAARAPSSAPLNTKRQAPAAGASKASAAKFCDFEAQMLGELAALAKAQKSAKAP